jgi:hypothetical protein
MRSRGLVLLCALLIANTAEGDEASSLYAQGRYKDAIALGEAATGSVALSAAAEAALAEAGSGDAVCVPCAKQADALARRAIAADPANARAYVYLVWAIGYEARDVGLLAAHNAHYAEEGKRAADAAMRLAPNDAYSLAALGGWHLEVTRFGGPFLAGLFYGAHADKGIENFRKAIAAAPADPILSYHYALLLASIGLPAHRDEVALVLRRTEAAKAQGAYETLLRTRAASLRALLDSGSDAEALRQIKLYLGVRGAAKR